VYFLSLFQYLSTPSLASRQPRELSQTGVRLHFGRPLDQFFLSASFHLSSHGGCSTTQKPSYRVYAVKQITCAEGKTIITRCKEKGL
jgi:hypothetical protein